MKYTADDLRALDSALATKCVEDLKKLARNYYVQGSAKMRKQELIGDVGRALVEPGRMEELIYVMISRRCASPGPARQRNWS